MNELQVNTELLHAFEEGLDPQHPGVLLECQLALEHQRVCCVEHGVVGPAGREVRVALLEVLARRRSRA